LEQVLQSDPCFTRAYHKILATLTLLGRPEDARDFFENLLAQGPKFECARYGLALYYRQKNRLDRAEDYLQSCVQSEPRLLAVYAQIAEVARQRGKSGVLEKNWKALSSVQPTNDFVWFGLAHLYVERHDWVRATAALDRVSQALGAEWEVEEDRYWTKYYTDKVDVALNVLARMLKRAQALYDPEHEGIALGRMGMSYPDISDFDRASSSLERAIQLLQTVDDHGDEEIFRGNLGMVYAFLGRYDDALKQCGEAIEIAKQLGRAEDLGRHFGLIANIYNETGYYEKALQAYTGALQISRKTSDVSSQVYQLGNIALVYKVLGKSARGLDFVGEARGLIPVLPEPNPKLEGDLLQTRGALLSDIGHYTEALPVYLRSLAIAQRTGDLLSVATRQAAVSGLEARAGNSRAAIQGLNEALHNAQAVKARIVEGEIWNGLGDLQLARGNLVRAQGAFLEAQALARETQMPEILWRADAGLGQVAEQNHQPIEAIRQNSGAIEAIEHVRARAGLPEEKAGFFASKVKVYRRQIRLLLSLHETNPQENYLELAFAYAERSRARAFLDSISESSHLGIHGGENPDLARRQRDLEARLSGLQSKVIDAYAGQSSPNLRALPAGLAKADEEYLSLKREIRREIPAYSAFRYSDPLQLKDVQASLADDSVLLSYTLDTPVSFLIAISHEKCVVARLPAEDVLASRVEGLRKSIAAGPSRMMLADFVSRSSRLYEDLIRPVETIIRGKRRLIFIPDGALHYLPFAALLKSRPGALSSARVSQLPYLIRRYAISYTPSATVLSALHERRAKKDLADKALLAVGDPMYSSAKSGTQQATLPGFDGRSGLIPLPYSRTEVQSIAKLYPPASVSVLTGADATVENVKRKADDYRILHFAVHGIIDETNPQFSGLALAHRNGAGEVLPVYQILDLRLKADLVVLSACETGLGRYVSGEGLVGLSEAFLYAGAPSVVVSLWRVDDQSTSELMINLHRTLQTPIFSKASSLQKAQLNLIDQRVQFAHPYYWAAFSLIGDSN
jgi:CHAT domain-containing protein/Tfp pilus assembly protein PilF